MNPSYDLASRKRRFCAWGIDAILVPGLTIFLVMVAGVLEDAEDYTTNWWMVWVLLLAITSYLLLNGYLLWQSGQTVGKRILGIAIRSQDGERPAFWKLILIRAWFFPLSFLLPAFPVTLVVLLDLLPIFSSARRCGHDWLSGTVVVKQAEAKL